MNGSPLAAARLALEDGTILTGRSFGAWSRTPVTGEVVFNTAMTGYQEALTDPSYAGQILVMTTPLIGNYGVCAGDVESARPQVAGFVVRERARFHSNHRAEDGLAEWLADAGVPGLEGVDTRALVRRLRIGGAMRGVLTSDPALDDAALVAMAAGSPTMTGANLAAEVSVDAATAWPGPAPREGWRVVAIDCGGKRSIYEQLTERGCEVTLVPIDADAATIRALEPAGLFISNGPGDPAAVASTIDTLRVMAGEVPTFGICLGHQLLALALGATTYKLKFGHRGANQPVLEIATGRVEITSQNHGFCVEEDSLVAAGCVVTHRHLNDGTVAGFRHRERPIFAVQHHPEASPGPHDARYLFDRFIALIDPRSEPGTVAIGPTRSARGAEGRSLAKDLCPK